MVRHAKLERKSGIKEQSLGNPPHRGFAGVLVVLGLGLVLAVAFVTLGGGAPLQTETTAVQVPAAVPAPDPPGTIDGAKNPELIPDAVALRMIVLAVAEPPYVTEEMKERARSKLNPIGLSEDDAVAFLALLSEFQGRADLLAQQANAILARTPTPSVGSTEYKSLVEIAGQRDQLLRNAVAAIPSRVSEEGIQKLEAYLPRAKKGMKIMP